MRPKRKPPRVAAFSTGRSEICHRAAGGTLAFVGGISADFSYRNQKSPSPPLLVPERVDFSKNLKLVCVR